MLNFKSTIIFAFVLGLYSFLVSAQNFKCKSPFAIGRHPTDCKKWFRCSYGIPYAMKDCKPGMLFSAFANTCVLEGGIWDDCHKRPTNPTGGESPQQRCSNSPGITLPKPDNCAQFYNCSLPISHPRPGYLGDYVDECPYPKLFSTDTLKCEDFQHVRCGQRKEIIYACDYKKLQCPVAMCRPCRYDFPDCRDLSDGPHQWAGLENTPRYASCLKGRGFPQQCSRGKVFSPVTRTCELRSNWLSSKRR